MAGCLWSGGVCAFGGLRTLLSMPGAPSHHYPLDVARCRSIFADVRDSDDGIAHSKAQTHPNFLRIGSSTTGGKCDQRRARPWQMVR